MKVIDKPKRNITVLSTFVGCQFRCAVCSTVVALEYHDTVGQVPCVFVSHGTRTVPEWHYQCPTCRLEQIKVGDMHVLYGGDGAPLKEGDD